MTELPDLPELAMFDRRATRGAVVRGLLRTAMIAVGLYLAVLVLGFVVGTVALVVNDRGDRFARLGATAFDVGHPDLQRYGPRGGRISSDWLHTTNRMDRVGSDGQVRDVRVLMSTLGHLSLPDPPVTDLDAALLAGPLPPSRAASYLTGLPASSLTDAVVQLRRPQADPDGMLLGRFAPRAASGLPVRFYADPFPGTVRSSSVTGEPLVRRPVSGTHGGPEDFTAWTRSLSAVDDDDLTSLGLPDSRTLRRLGRTPMTHALYLSGATPAQLLRVLRDPEVLTVTPVASRLGLAARGGS